MALLPVNTLGNPLGQYDGLDSQVLNLKGGEVVTFTSVVNSGAAADKAAKDSFDGYALPSNVQKRPVVTNTLTSTSRPLMLADDGTTGYGTLFGTVVGGTVGQVATGGANLGPHTATASGKVTCWYQAGVYKVTLDACDTAATGLVPTNTNLDAGTALVYTSAGLLTPSGSVSAVGGAPTVGRFIEFETNGSLVNTPNKLVAALNSPSGNVTSLGTNWAFTVATFYWVGGL